MPEGPAPWLRRLAHHGHAVRLDTPAAAAGLLAGEGCTTKYASFAEPPIDVPAHQLSATGLTDPLRRLARGETPAIVLRNMLPEADCYALLQRCHEEGQFPPSFLPFLPCVDSAAPSANRSGLEPLMSTRMSDGGGGGAAGKGGQRRGHGRVVMEDAGASRTDIGYSLGTGGNFPETYFDKCAAVHDLYGKLLEGVPPKRNALRLMYEGLQTLSGGTKRVINACERDGRSYGPAIIRTHKPETGDGVGHTYHPHYDSVRRREVRKGFEVYRFQTQLAGILVLQAPERMAAPGAETGPVYHDSIL